MAKTSVCNSALWADLTSLLGEKAIVTEDRAIYERGYRYGHGEAAAIVRPSNLDEVRALISYCIRNDIGIISQGAHTGLVGAATPGPQDDRVLVNLGRMNRITAFSAVDRSMTCEAGTLLSTINERSQAEGLSLPIDLGADPSIGGMIATNTGGAKLLRYGDMRRNLQGLEVVLADEQATVWSDLTGLRKDNTGLDLKQLFVGSGGKTGIITAATVELQPLARQRASAMLVPKSLSDAPHILCSLEGTLGELLTACEGMSGNAMSLALRHHPSIQNPFPNAQVPPFAILVEAATCASLDSGIDIQSVLAGAIWPLMESSNPLLENVLMTEKDDFWALRHSISDGLKREGRVLAFDISTRRSQLPDLIGRLTSLIREIEPEALACPFGHLGDGGVHFNLVTGPDTPINDAQIRDAVYRVLVDEFSGSISAEHGIGPLNQRYYDDYVPEWKRNGAEELIKMLDPQGLLR